MWIGVLFFWRGGGDSCVIILKFYIGEGGNIMGGGYLASSLGSLFSLRRIFKSMVPLILWLKLRALAIRFPTFF